MRVHTHNNDGRPRRSVFFCFQCILLIFCFKSTSARSRVMIRGPIRRYINIHTMRGVLYTHISTSIHKAERAFLSTLLLLSSFYSLFLLLQPSAVAVRVRPRRHHGARRLKTRISTGENKTKTDTTRGPVRSAARTCFGV